MEDIDKRIDEYSGLFDLYIEGKPIPPEYKDDPVAGYIEEICQDSGNKELCRKEETWKEIFRKEIISMLEVYDIVHRNEKLAAPSAGKTGRKDRASGKDKEKAVPRR